MIDWEYANLFYGSHDKQWDFLDMDPESTLIITNDNIVSESISFERGMCENDTYFYGTYSSACMKVNVLMPEERFIGKRFLVQIRIDNHPLQIGYLTCASDKLSSDRRSRELVMYDDLYKLNEIDVAGWYKEFFEETVPEDAYFVTFRLAFFEHLGIECESTDSQGTALANDFVLIKKAADYRTLSASAVLKSILAFNFQNGMMTNLGKFRFMRIKEYDIHMAPPDPHIDIIPDAVIDTSGFYTCRYEDYQVWNADGMQLIIDPDHVIIPTPSGQVLPTHDNILSVSYDNMFFRDMEEQDILQTLLNAFNEVTTRASFTPMEINMRGNLCYEPGDVIEVDIDNKTLYTVIIKQTFTGVQGLTMTIVSRGEEKFSNPLTVESTSYDDYAGAENGGGNADFSKTAWKLRSAVVDDETGERYYTYLTENKHFIVSNNRDAGHSSENDRTDQCTIGQSANPWYAGYFRNLFVDGEPVGKSLGTVCTKIEATLLANGWSNGQQTITVTGVDADETKQCIQISAPSASYQAFLDAQIMVISQAANSLTFRSGNVPSADIDIYVVLFTVVEDASMVSF